MAYFFRAIHGELDFVKMGAWVACNGYLIRMDSNFQINQKYRIAAEGLHAKLRRNIFFRNLVIGPDSSSAFIRKITRGLERLLPRLPLRRMSLDLHDVSNLPKCSICCHCPGITVSLCFKLSKKNVLQPLGFIYIDTYDDDLRHVNSIYPTSNGLYMTMFSLKGRDIKFKKTMEPNA